MMDGLADERDDLTRRLLALALLTERLERDQIQPILVGGMALELYTAGGYSTGDVDLALPMAAEVDEAFAELGFEKRGRFWIQEELDLYFEAPAPAGLPGENAPRGIFEIEGLNVHVIGVEDLLLDRLRAWVHWQSTEDERWSRRLATLYFDRLDWKYLLKRAGTDRETQALESLRNDANPEKHSD